MSLNINVIKDKILSENWFVLRNMTYELTRSDGSVVRHKREVYDRGNGATILLYNPEKKTVVLIRQFRVATWVNGNEDGQLIETCAGLLDNDEPEACIRKEAIEETGYEVGDAHKLAEFARLRRTDRRSVTGFTHSLIQLFDRHDPVINTVRGLSLSLLDSIGPLRRAFAGHLVFGVGV